ncbi:MAG: SdrD B-like domain-containing protein [Methanohalophilus sp.]
MRQKIIVTILMILALAVIVQFASAASVDPIRVDKSGPSLCGDYHAFKIEESNVDPGTREVSDGNISLNVTIYDANNDGDDEALNWTLNTPEYKIMRVVVMDGVDGGNMYNYTSGATSDTNLTTPGPDQGSSYTFKDISHVDFCYIASSDTPGINIEKSTNGLDADSIEGPVIVAGSPVEWVYIVTNNGTVNLTDINVKDNVSGVNPEYINGDTNGDGFLNITETWYYNATGNAIEGQYSNWGNVTGNYDGKTVNDSDPSHYFGVNASLGDFVWEDLDTDGVQDPGEPGIAGIPVELYYCNNTYITNTTTDANGNYLFDKLFPGEYYVKFIKPAGYEFTLQDQGGDDSKDSDVDTDARTDCVNLSALESDLTIDAGLYTPALISDFVWNDVNTNGIQDNGETGIADVNVSLYDCSDGSLIENTVTNASGYYNFTVNPGSYFLGFELPTGYAFTMNDQGSDDLDSDVDPATGNTSCITVQSGDINTTFDTGMFEVIPGIDIEKSTNGEDADEAPGPYIRLNYEVVWEFNVTNTGNVNLTDIEVIDDELGLIGTIPLLQPGESQIMTRNATANLGQYENTATAVGVSPTGINVTDSDPSHYFGHDSQPNFEVPTANPLLIIGMLGLAGVMVLRRRDK